MKNEQEQEKVAVEEKLDPAKGRCSAYDADCEDVPNHLQCFLGKLQCGIGVADGHCPYVQRVN